MSIQSIQKAIDAMRVFSPEEPYLSLAEISERLGIPKSTVHNILNTLAGSGFIEKTSDDYYALGTAVISLAQAARVNAELRDRAAPLLRRCADLVKESVYLTYFEGDHVLYIYAIETPNRLMARSAVGDRVQMHCTGVGKAVLSALTPYQVEDIVGRRGMTAFTPFTITTLETLHEDLEATRQRGYSIDNQEHEIGTYCVGAVIRDNHGKAIGGCSISGRDREIIGARAETLSVDLLYTAQEISRRMGYVPSTPSLLVHRSGFGV